MQKWQDHKQHTPPLVDPKSRAELSQLPRIAPDMGGQGCNSCTFLLIYSEVVQSVAHPSQMFLEVKLHQFILAGLGTNNGSCSKTHYSLLHHLLYPNHSHPGPQAPSTPSG